MQNKQNLLSIGKFLKCFSSSTSKTRYPSAKTRLQPISMNRGKRNSSVGSLPNQTSSIITAGNTMMGNNPMVVKKLFPENPAHTGDRIMTPPIILGTGGYRHNQLPPIDNAQEVDSQQVRSKLHVFVCLMPNSCM